MTSTRNTQINRFVRRIVFALAFGLLAIAFSCAGPNGVRTSPIVPVATFASDPALTNVIADARSNGNTTVIRATIYGVAGLRDAYSGVWIMEPRTVAPGKVYVWRREPKFSGEFGPTDPLPTWVQAEQGLWRPGEAEALGYLFEPQS